jgi:hypothetical protein
MTLSQLQSFFKRLAIEYMLTEKSLRFKAESKHKIEKVLLLFDIIKKKEYTIENGGLGVCMVSPLQASVEILDLEKLQQDEQDIINSFVYRYEREPRTRLDKLKIQYNAKVSKANNGKVPVRLPGADYTIAAFGKDLGNAFKDTELIFYREKENEIVEIKEHYDELLRKKITAFRKVDAVRLLNIIEEVVSTYYLSDGIAKSKSPNEQHIKLIMKNSDFLESIYKVDRFLQYPMPFMINGKLEVPHKGYNQKFQAYLTENSPEVEEMDIAQAKELITSILSEFCFENDIDRTLAIAYLLTPACRGLYSSITERSPIFLITANRERAGKDYLAGVQGILYEGRAIDDPPIITGGRDQNNEELRKKLTSALKMGRRRYHSANNKGRIDSAVLEGFVTSKVWQDRELGGNTILELNNEMDMSLSANIGITYSPDFWHRSRKISLFFSEEDPNKRVFKTPNLHGYVLENREQLLCAVYTLLKSWVDAGSPSDTVFSSFPEWARVVGGIMKYHELGDPCVKLEDDAVGGDKESQDMKELFKNMYEHQTTTINNTGNTMAEIMNLIESKHDDWGIFSYFDMTQSKDRVKFSLTLRKWLGREMDEIVLKVNDPYQRPNRQKFTFFKKKQQNEGSESGRVVRIGKVCIPVYENGFENNIHRAEVTSVPKPTTLPKPKKEDILLFDYLEKNGPTKREMLEVIAPAEVLDDLLNKGMLVEVSADTLDVVQ